MLINRNFSLLWAGQIVSQIGDKFYAIALAWWILEKTNSPSMMGTFLIAAVLPSLLFGPIAGGLIDRWNRKAILIVADLLRGAIVVAVTLLSWLGILEVWHVFAAAIGISLGTAFFDPTVKAVIPQLVEEEKLPHANALSQLIVGITTIIGPVLGATFVAFFGFTLVFLINSISYIISACFEGVMVIARTAGSARTSKVASDIKEGLVFIKSNRQVSTVLVAIGIGHFFIGSLMVIMPFLAKQLSGSGVRNLGYLETMIGVGVFFASVLIKTRKKAISGERLLFSAMATVGLWLSLIGVVKLAGILWIVPFLAIAFLIGASIAMAAVFWQSLLQVNVKNEMAGRVFSIAGTLGNASFPVAYGLFGVLLAYYPIPSVLLVSGICLIAASTVLMWSFRKGTEFVAQPADT
jgi:MFS family permease